MIDPLNAQRIEELRELWEEINESEINCIISENGYDRELDYDREVAVEKIHSDWVQNKYPQLLFPCDE